MDEPLQGTPEAVAQQLVARYEPLRDSRAFCEPEQNQRSFLETTSYILVVGGIAVEVLLAVTGHFTAAGGVFGAVVAGLGLPFWKMSKRPLKYTPPEPLDNLAALSQGIGLCHGLDKAFPTMVIDLEPISSTLRGSCDGYDWELTVKREGLKPVDRDKRGYDNAYTLLKEQGSASGAPKIWRRSSHTVNSHRIVWSVSVDGEFNPRPGQPSEHASLERHESRMGKTLCVFTLPVNQPDKPGLGHEGRTDYISSPLGLHHPEFVGEQIALSLAWMFNPHQRL